MRSSPLIALLPMATAALLPDAPGVSRRAVLAGVAGMTIATPALPALALFESQEQQALVRLATAQPKLKGVITEVAEVKRRRLKNAVDPEDDAYIVRFARSVLDPASKEMLQALPILSAPRAKELPSEFSNSVTELITACRAKTADGELEALVNADKALSEFLQVRLTHAVETLVCFTHVHVCACVDAPHNVCAACGAAKV